MTPARVQQLSDRVRLHNQLEASLRVIFSGADPPKPFSTAC
jgi:hypothetical protein